MEAVYILMVKPLIQIVSSSGERDTGAVASAEAAKIYGLDVLAEKIQVRHFLIFFMCLGVVNMKSNISILFHIALVRMMMIILPDF